MATFNGTTGNDTLVGSGLSDFLAGLAGNDSMAGALGDDTLDGSTGSDTLDGGGGNDTYVIDSAKDVIVETGGDTSDRIQASISIDLNSAAYDGVEHVTLTGTGALNATGDDDDNFLVGNSGANKLDGGVGADTMLGGAGNDTYEVDDSTDAVVELAGDGTDQVNASASFTLGAGVENLTLTGTALVGIGNALANKITASSTGGIIEGVEGNDTLIGGNGNDVLDGGPGADSMSGGKGVDQYVVDDPGDKITEIGPASDGNSVQSSITYILGSNLENLTLAGTEAIDGTGNSLNNRLLGNDKANTLSGLTGDDTLNGAGGKDLLLASDGNDLVVGERDGDTLVGGSGNDVFQFATSGSQKDVIADFNGLPGADLIDLSDLLAGSGITAATAGNFLQAVSADGSTTLRIDTDGTKSFVDLALLEGVTTDLAGLLANADIHVFPSDLPAATAVVGTTAADVLAAAATSELVQGLGGNDSLSGGSGSGFDTLDGGTGSDTLAGGKGGDTYIVDSTKDVVIETGNDPDDRIQASVSIDLNNAAYDGIERVTLTGTSGLSATGDAFANMLIGNIGANKLDGGADADTMIGGAGNDTYQVDDGDDSIIEFDGEGTDQVNSSASFTLSGSIENLTLTGTADIDGIGNALGNKITGNTGANELNGRNGNDTLTGNDGNDGLDGGKGADSLIGGKGNDQYFVDDPGDKISETGGSSDTDTVFAAISFVLGATLENLTIDGVGPIDGTGNALANTITGNTSVNILSGLAGNDILDGGLEDDVLLGGDANDLLISNDGADTLVGGSGGDVFQFGGANGSTIADFDGLPGGDAIDLEFLLPSGVTAANAAEFLQTVTSHGSTTLLVDEDGSGGGSSFVATALLQGVSTDLAGLLANATIVGVENLVATSVVGTNAGDTLAVAAGVDSTLLQGLGGNDTLSGGKGSDTLDGGTGSDSLVGGNDNDTYIIDSAKDVIVDVSGTDDRIQASISIDLNAAAYANIEHVTLTGTGALNATGNDGDNLLIGNAGANLLDGRGGDDQLAGGAGNDTYVVDSFGDVISENPGEGTDQVNASTSCHLSANVENLTLTGTDDSIGEGNDLANKITGNTGANLLVGDEGNDTLTGNDGNDTLDGGTGTDSMTGGIGDDSYFVDSSSDKVAESSATGGNDEVISSVGFTLGSNLENLTLLDVATIGTNTVDGTGNSLNNVMTARSGNNVLSGLAGNDTLDGGAGNDLLIGGDGADQLKANEGADTLAGGSGSDRFIFNGASLSGTDVITDFTSAPGGDVLDVSDVLTGFNPASSNINDFLKAVENNGSTTIQVDANGGGNSFVDMAVLQGVNTDVMGLLSNGSLILSD